MTRRFIGLIARKQTLSTPVTRRRRKILFTTGKRGSFTFTRFIFSVAFVASIEQFKYLWHKRCHKLIST